MMIKSVEGKNKTAQANGPASYLSLQHQVLPLPILQHLQRLQGTHNVHWIDSSFLTDLCAPNKINNRQCVLCICMGAILFKAIVSCVNKQLPPTSE